MLWQAKDNINDKNLIKAMGFLPKHPVVVKRSVDYSAGLLYL